MKYWIINTILALTLLFSINVYATDYVDRQHINQLVMGGPSSQRQAAQSMYRAEETNTKVLDIAAEVLFQNYNKPGKTEVDAAAWLCKTLGASKNPRYRSVLKIVSRQADNAKLRKYAGSSLKKLSGKEVKQYKKGSVNLAKIRKKAKKNAKKNAAKQSGSNSKQSISSVQKGMSMQEAYNLAGDPTSSRSHVTGKAFSPFYYGGDTSRVIAYYKGQGRIIFSQSNKYSRTWRVVEVLINPNESGYP